MDGMSNLHLLSICQHQNNSIKKGRDEVRQKITFFKFLNYDKKYIFKPCLMLENPEACFYVKLLL